MCVEVKFVHLVAIFAKVYQCKQGGQIFVPKTFPTFRLLRNLAIYIAVLRDFMVFLLFKGTENVKCLCSTATVLKTDTP